LAAYFNNNGIVFVTNVSVLNNFVGYGIASNLLDMCIEHARKNNFQEITLEVCQRNSNAVRFYKKFSFTMYETKSDTLLLRRQIP
jgi:ribosomal protein S18 acetylase RimI-like enzyme